MYVCVDTRVWLCVQEVQCYSGAAVDGEGRKGWRDEDTGSGLTAVDVDNAKYTYNSADRTEMLSGIVPSNSVLLNTMLLHCTQWRVTVPGECHRGAQQH